MVTLYPDSPDRRVTARGAMIAVAFILLLVVTGVYTAERGVNNLLGIKEPPRAFNLGIEAPGKYKAYLLGEALHVSRTVTLGAIETHGRTVVFGVSGRRVKVETLVNLVELRTIEVLPIKLIEWFQSISRKVKTRPG